jgi:hypothetical protein
MNVINDMATDAKNLLYAQGVQLEIGANRIKNAKNNIKLAKNDMKDARDYVQDHNKRTMYICIFITLLITIVLLIMYAGNKKK